MFHGLTSTQMRRFAFDMAEANQVKIPKSRKINKSAGVVWLQGFMERSKNLSLRLPEPTSVARATAFNRHNINIFFNNLDAIYSKTKATAHTIYNLDETGLTTTHKPPKVISCKGEKQVGQIVSQERGELVTMCGIVSAAGLSVPPVIIFPRKNFRDIFLRGAPEGSPGLCNPSGWMNAELYIDAIKHFIKFVRPSVDRQVVLVCDNHFSHISLPALEFAEQNFVHIVTLPPHTSHRTQPLDRSVFGLLKAYYNAAANSWMLRNPDRPITIYEMGELIGDAWKRAATPTNIMSGFKSSGVWSFNQFVFDSDMFLPSDVTDRPQPHVEPASVDQNSSSDPSSLGPQPVSSILGPSYSGPRSAAPTSGPSCSGPQQATFCPGPSSSGPQQASSSPDLITSGPQQASSTSGLSSSGPQSAAPTPGQSSSGPQLASYGPGPSSSGPQSAATAPGPSSSGLQPASLRPGPSSSGLQPASPSPGPSSSGPQSASPTLGPSSSGPRSTTPTPGPSSSGPQSASSAPTTSSVVTTRSFKVTPEDLKGYPKAPARTASRKGRKRGRSMVATSTPEINRIREELLSTSKKSKITKKLFEESDDSDDDIALEDCLDILRDECEDDNNLENGVKDIELGLVETVNKGDYVMCEFASKKP